MTGLFESLFLPLAQKAAAPAAGNDSFIWSLVPFLPVVFLFYFMILRPQQQQERKRKAMIEALKRNDKVLTTAGIYGTVVSVDSADDRIVIRVDDGVKLTFSKASIARVLEQKDEKPKEAVSSGVE